MKDDEETHVEPDDLHFVGLGSRLLGFGHRFQFLRGLLGGRGRGGGRRGSSGGSGRFGGHLVVVAIGNGRLG